MNWLDANTLLPLWLRHPLRWLLKQSDPAFDRPPVYCEHCGNPDRNSIYGEYAWAGCRYQGDGDGADPPCVCDGYGTPCQQNRLGYTP